MLIDLPKDKKIGWMIFEDKKNLAVLNKGYLNCLEKLQETCDIVVVDVIDFSMFVGEANDFKGKLRTDYPIISQQQYYEYFRGYADHVIIQTYEEQYARFQNNSEMHIGLKNKIRTMPPRYDSRYAVNKRIFRGFVLLFEMYKADGLNIAESVNMWKCGYRSYLYQDYLIENLGIKMHILDPLFDGNVVMTDAYVTGDPETRAVITDLSNQLTTIADFQNYEECSVKYIWHRDNFIIGEMLIQAKKHKIRLVMKYDK